MTYNVALLVDPYRSLFRIVDTADDYVEAWRRAAMARRLLDGRIFFVVSNETREDPKPRNRRSRSNAPIGRDKHA
jgi:hypothetical protein